MVGKSFGSEDLVQSKNSSSIYGSVPETAEAIFVSLVAGQSLRGEPIPETWSKLWTKFTRQRRHYRGELSGIEPTNESWKSWRNFIIENRNFEVFGYWLTRWPLGLVGDGGPPDGPTAETELEDINEMISIVGLTIWSQRVITTEKGRVGLSVLRVEAGDVIALLVGCDAPLVLGQRGSEYELVGECYIHGLMDGK